MRIQNRFQEIFLLTFSNLSNDGIISAFARCENGWGNWHFLVWNRGQDLENRAAQIAPRIPRSTPSYLINYGPVISFVYTSLQACQIQKNHSS